MLKDKTKCKELFLKEQHLYEFGLEAKALWCFCLLTVWSQKQVYSWDMGKVRVRTQKVIPPSFVFAGMLLMGTKSCTPSTIRGKKHFLKSHVGVVVLILKCSESLLLE